jgi:hypothetical protein
MQRKATASMTPSVIRLACLLGLMLLSGQDLFDYHARSRCVEVAVVKCAVEPRALSNMAPGGNDLGNRAVGSVYRQAAGGHHR